MINIDLNGTHSLAAANAHYYKEPTAAHYIDRVIPYHDLVYLVDGGWSFTEDEIEYPLEKDDVILLAAGRHHYNRESCLPGTRTFCIHVTRDEGDIESNPAARQLPTRMNVKNAPAVKQCFLDIVSAYWTDSPCKEQKLSAFVNLLFLLLCEEYQKQSSAESDIAAKALEIVMTAPHRHMTSKEVAETLFISTKTLDNAMRRRFGVPFYTYSKNLKLDMVALRLEMEPELKLHEIAAAYGYHDEFHMSKAFKQKFGISPSEYRDRNQKAV